MPTPRIIFMGTPEFAVASLKALVVNGFEVAAVITAPDKPKGRGQQLAASPVKEYAVSANLPVLQPANLKSPEFHEELRSYDANLFVVVAFRMLPEVVWTMPELGTFNLHASLLPQYRGAAPINWAIINGETETGVTTFFIRHEIDTGTIILQAREQISRTDTAGTLYERLMKKGASLVLKTVEQIRDGSYQLTEQKDTGNLKTAPKLFKENCQIDWNWSAERIYNFVRGLSPYPAAWTILNEKTYKIYEVSVMDKAPGTPGSITIEIGDITIAAGQNAIRIHNLQAEGKKRMNAKEFLRGNTI